MRPMSRGKPGTEGFVCCPARRYVTSGDLDFFKRSVEATSTPASQAGPWEQMMDREIPGVIKYTAWRRTLAVRTRADPSMFLIPQAQPSQVWS